MNLMIVFGFAGDSTMTRFLAIRLLQRRSRGGEPRNSSRARHARACALFLFVLIAGAGSLVLLGLVVQRFVGDTENFGCLPAIAIGHVERFLDHEALDFLHRLTERDGDGILRPALPRTEELV